MSIPQQMLRPKLFIRRIFHFKGITQFLRKCLFRIKMTSRQEIMNAVERRDASAAVKLIADHIDKQQKEIKESIESMEG